MFNTLAVIGLGYIGLPTAAVLAAHNQQVIGVDTNLQVVDAVNQGKVLITEPQLEELVAEAVKKGNLRATSQIEAADVFLITVPTPLDAQNQPDLSFIRAVAENLAPVLAKGNLVILESTVPVGTTQQLATWLADLRSDLTFPQQADEEADIQLAFCPERVLPGQIVTELITNDRIIGGLTTQASQRALELYKIFVKGDAVITQTRTAELCKLIENSFRDVNLAFANELSMLCDTLDIDVWQLIELANRHPRVNVLQPSTGVGGHCIAVDPWFVMHSAPQNTQLISCARQVNLAKPLWVLDKIKATMLDILTATSKPAANLTVACLGLAFKPDVNDLRGSPALSLVTEVAKIAGQVLVVEPNIDVLPANLQQNNLTLVSLEEALQAADLVCVLVKHTSFVQAKNQLASCQYLVDAVGCY